VADLGAIGAANAAHDGSVGLRKARAVKKVADVLGGLLLLTCVQRVAHRPRQGVDLKGFVEHF